MFASLAIKFVTLLLLCLWKKVYGHDSYIFSIIIFVEFT